MQSALEDFFKALRGSMLEPSLGAQLDASRAVALVGWHDRALLKSALGATLAKTVPDRAVCDEVFDRFFRFDAFAGASSTTAGSPPAATGHGAAEAGLLPGEAAGLAAAGSAGSGGSGGGQRRGEDSNNGDGDNATPPLSQLLLSGDAAALAQRMQEAAREAGLTDIWFFTQKGYYTQRIQRAMGLETLDRDIADAKRNGADPARAKQLELARKRLFEEVRGYVERQLALYAKAPTQQLRDDFLLQQKLSHIDPRDFARMQAIVGKLARRLAERHARRKKQRLRGQLDFRRTLRRNAAYGGVMFEVFWRRKVVDRPRIVAICDVSGSVRQYARFLLLFLHSLGEQVSDLRSFAFTSRLVDVSHTFETLPVAQAIDRVMKTVGGGGTDYGQMLLDLNAQLLDDIDRRTTVLILCDARNNGGDAQAEVMKLLYQRARRVIWLNPEPETFWGLGDSEMKRYAPYCHIARECNSIHHLERTLDALLRSHAAGA